MKAPKTSSWIVLLAFTLLFGIAILDHLSTFGPVPWYGLFVIPVVWIALWSAEDDVLLLAGVATLATGLAILPVLWSVGTDRPVPVTERAMAIATVWLTVLIALLRKRAQRTYKWINLAGRR